MELSKTGVSLLVKKGRELRSTPKPGTPRLISNSLISCVLSTFNLRILTQLIKPKFAPKPNPIFGVVIIVFHGFEPFETHLRLCDRRALSSRIPLVEAPTLHKEAAVFPEKMRFFSRRIFIKKIQTDTHFLPVFPFSPKSSVQIRGFYH